MTRKFFLRLLFYPAGFSFLNSCFRTPQANPIATFDPPPNPLKIINMTGDHTHEITNIPENNIILGIGGTYKLSGGNHIHDFRILSHEMRALRDGTNPFFFTLGGDHQHTFYLQYQPVENK